MINIIIADLDGTLLQNGAQEVSRRALELIKELHRKGIIFVAASGRQYANLFRLFKDASEHMAFICENGALIMYAGKVIQKSSMERNTALKLIEDIYQREGCEVLASGQNTSYLKPKDNTYTDRIANILKNNTKIVENHETVTEDFIKISVYEKAGIMEHSAAYFINKWQDKVKCTVSGFGWLDFVNKNVNKGMALLALLDVLHIPASEAMAFGDNYNDLEMLSLVKYGYVMENAVEEIKSMYQYHTALVEDTLEEIINMHLLP